MDWAPIKQAEKALDLLRPVNYIPDPSIETAKHACYFRPRSIRGKVRRIRKHAIRYNPGLECLDISLIHELSHAKTDETGFYSVPPLKGELSQEWDKGWSWIDEYYGHMKLGFYLEDGLFIELSNKITNLSDHVGTLLETLPEMDPKRRLPLVVFDLSRHALYEVLIAKFGFEQLAKELEGVGEAWGPFFKPAIEQMGAANQSRCEAQA